MSDDSIGALSHQIPTHDVHNLDPNPSTVSPSTIFQTFPIGTQFLGPTVLQLTDPSPSSDLVAHFADWHHPTNPILSAVDLLSLINTQSHNKPYSLLLLNAVCFVAADTVGIKVLSTYGFHSRQSAKTAFYEGALDLYDNNHEKDLTRVLQGILLLSTCEQRRSQMLELAASIVQDLRLNKLSPSAQCDAYPVTQLRRIFWIFVTRDLENAFTKDQAPHHSLEDTEIPTLCSSDFDDLYPQPYEIDPISTPSPSLLDRSLWTQTTLACIERSNMICSLSAVLPCFRGKKSGGCSSPVSATTRTAMERDETYTSASRSAMSVLMCWRNKLPPSLEQPGTPAFESARLASILTFHWAAFHLSFYMLTLTLNEKGGTSGTARREPTDSSGAEILSRPVKRGMSQVITQKANKVIYEILHSLWITDTLCRLPSSTVKRLVPILVQFAFRNNDSEIVGFNKCLSSVSDLPCLSDVSDLDTELLQVLVCVATASEGSLASTTGRAAAP